MHFMESILLCKVLPLFEFPPTVYQVFIDLLCIITLHKSICGCLMCNQKYDL